MTLSPNWITWTRRVLLGAAVLATIGAVLVVEENWRGNRDWRRVEAEYAARHEPLQVSAFFAPQPSDRENLFKAPVWSDLTAEDVPPARYNAAWTASGLEKLSPVRAVSVVPLNLADARQEMIRAGLLPKEDARPLPQAVLAGLQPIMALCDGVRAAVRERPAGGVRVVPPFLFNNLRLGSVWSVAKLLGFRARVELAAGQPLEAYEDTIALLRIALACEVRPATLLQSLVAVAIRGQASDTIKSALLHHVWSDAQLAALDSLVKELRGTAYFEEGLRAERASQLAAIDGLSNLTQKQRTSFALPRWLPPGALQENKVELCAASERNLSVIRSIGSPEFEPRLKELERERKDIAGTHRPSLFFVRLVEVRITGIFRAFALDLEGADATVLALALERHFLAHGQYPATLAELTPTYLTCIPVLSDGRAFPYRATSAGAGFELQQSPGLNREPKIWVQPASAPKPGA